MDEVKLAIKALAYYVHGGGHLEFMDGNNRPERERPFTMMFRVHESMRYHVTWWRLMIRHHAALETEPAPVRVTLSPSQMAALSAGETVPIDGLELVAAKLGTRR